MNHPFIYFYIEPNLVFVYKMDSGNYVTVPDLSGKLETFELHDRETFETFDYHTSKPFEGRTYFLSQNDMNHMVEEINTYMQKHQHLFPPSQAATVHIVSSESAAGCLKVGLQRPRVVIGFPAFFSIGPIWQLHHRNGQAYRYEWIKENINFELDDYIYENKVANALREIEDIPSEIPIYIWYGNNADEHIGLRFLLYLLRNKENELFLINTTERYLFSNSQQQLYYTEQLEPQQLKALFEQENKPLANKVRIQLQQEWEQLAQMKDVLHVWNDNEIKAVPENHFDSLIIHTIEKLHNEQSIKDFILTGKVIEEIITQQNSYRNTFFLEYRIRGLVYSGVLALKGIPKSTWHYSVKIRD